MDIRPEWPRDRSPERIVVGGEEEEEVLEEEESDRGGSGPVEMACSKGSARQGERASEGAALALARNELMSV